MELPLDEFIRWLRAKKVKKYIPRNSIVCDIGCGSETYFLRKISNLIKYGFGFDEKIADYKDSKYEFKKLKILKEIPCPTESCDVVTMMAVLEHLVNPQEILNECFRILKNGGRLILTTPSSLAKPILEFLAFKIRLIDKSEIGDHKNYFRPADIKKMLLEAGFPEKNIKLFFFEFYLNQLIIAKK